MDSRMIIVKPENIPTAGKALSYSEDELESLIDDLVIVLPDVHEEAYAPYARALTLLTEIKIAMKGSQARD